MPNEVTLVMYHYVRPIRGSRFPGIKGREYEDFVGQLEYLRKQYQPVTREEMKEAVSAGWVLPRNAVVFTFDDGFADHYQWVFPLLEKYGIQGWFFPPAQPIVEHVVIDVHKIHFILASAAIEDVTRELMGGITEFRAEHKLPDDNTLRSMVKEDSRFDPGAVVFVKRMLQRDLPAPVRSVLTDRLFRKYVSEDEAAFASELYLSVQQLRNMVQRGMYVGSHGWSHAWLTSLPEAERCEEIRRSLDFLASLNAPTNDWVMSYPYGAWDDDLIRVVREQGCTIGITTEARVAIVDAEHALRLPRLDTNDLPVEVSSNFAADATGGDF